MLSIIVTTISEKNLFKCLDSITCKYPIEIIVLDHKGNDNIRSFCDQLNKVTNRSYIYKNIGDIPWGKAVNVGMNQAQYDLVLLTQDDIIFEWDSLDKLVNAYKTYDEGFLCPNTQEEMEHTNLHIDTDVLEITRDHIWAGRVFACFIFNKKTYNDIGPFAEIFYPIYYDDSDYLYRAALKGYPIRILSMTKVKHNTEIKLQLPLDENRKKYIKKWGGAPLVERWTVPYNGESNG